MSVGVLLAQNDAMGGARRVLESFFDEFLDVGGATGVVEIMRVILQENIDVIIHAARRAQSGSIQDYRELLRLVEARSPEEIHELIALMWLGRGDETADDWSDLLENAFGNDAEYLCEQALLAQYLEAGLRKLLDAGDDCPAVCGTAR